jgi:hypothetical protein
MQLPPFIHGSGLQESGVTHKPKDTAGRESDSRDDFIKLMEVKNKYAAQVDIVLENWCYFKCCVLYKAVAQNYHTLFLSIIISTHCFKVFSWGEDLYITIRVTLCVLRFAHAQAMLMRICL